MKLKKNVNLFKISANVQFPRISLIQLNLFKMTKTLKAKAMK